MGESCSRLKFLTQAITVLILQIFGILDWTPEGSYLTAGVAGSRNELQCKQTKEAIVRGVTAVRLTAYKATVSTEKCSKMVSAPCLTVFPHHCSITVKIQTKIGNRAEKEGINLKLRPHEKF